MSGGPTVERADFFVLVYKGQWMIAFDERFFGPCGTEQRAIRLATISGQKAIERGLVARVLSQEKGGFKVVWPAN